MKKRPQKITLGAVGTITEEHGLIPVGMSRKGPIPKGKSVFKDSPRDETAFLDTFGALEDPRSTRNQLYSVNEILLLTLCAVLCGAEGWQDIEDFGKAKLPFLRQYFEYAQGVPSDDTIRRFYRSLNPSEFERLFREWVECLAKTTGTKVIAIDGKCSRRSYDGEGNMLHMISAFSTEARIVLGQEKVSDKSNEITAIPKMLDWLDVKGHIITIDAMGCQHAIATQILKREGDYIFSLKGNQETLARDVQLYFEDPLLTKPTSFVDYDKGHGRIETRECWVVTDVKWLHDSHPKWSTIKSLIKIESTRELKGKISKETRYYMSSLTLPPEKILKAIRWHWGIENSLHWILDMSFNEDYSRIRKENAPHIMAIFRHVALNLLQAAKKERQSIKGLRKLCGWDESTLQSVISHKSS
ncbi:MAG: Transposase, is4 family [uncultured bacterium]|nr:MAG: Transposase, is4 family [uncultured bacterium]